MNQDFLKRDNASMVTMFLLEDFAAEVWEIRLLLSMFFLLMYLGTLLGKHICHHC
jgi:olfactory receptor